MARSHFNTIVAGLAALLVLSEVSTAVEPAPAPLVFLLRDTDDVITIETLELAEGETQVIPFGPQSGVIDVIAPVGPGGSGSVVRDRVESDLLVVRNIGGQLMRSVGPANGERRDLPAIALEDLGRYDTRVSVIGGDGRRANFLIEGFRKWRIDHVGPTLDVFSGRLPFELGDGEYTVCTDTIRRSERLRTNGLIPFTHERHLFTTATLPDGREGAFIIDLGGGESVIAREWLPAELAIRDSAMVEYSPAGRRLLKYEPGGATGAVTNVLGHATLPALRFGDVEYHDLDLAVMDKMPDFFARPVVGILGIDALSEAPIVRFRYRDGGASAIEFDSHPLDVNSEQTVTELPFTIVRTHIMVTGAINDRPVHFVLDTGAPRPLIDEAGARELSLSSTTAERPARGLDGGEVTMAHSEIPTLTLGARTFESVECIVADLPVFATIRSSEEPVGLLGNTFFSRFDAVEIDFERGRVRLID